jgi:hypothetical protein
MAFFSVQLSVFSFGSQGLHYAVQHDGNLFEVSDDEPPGLFATEDTDALSDIDLGSQLGGRAFGMFRKGMKSGFQLRWAPSAISEAIDTAARVIWSFKPRSRQ